MEILRCILPVPKVFLNSIKLMLVLSDFVQGAGVLQFESEASPIATYVESSAPPSPAYSTICMAVEPVGSWIQLASVANQRQILKVIATPHFGLIPEIPGLLSQETLLLYALTTKKGAVLPSPL